MYKTPVNILEEDINNLFKKNPKNDIDIIFSTVNLLLMKNEHNTDLAELYKLFDYDLDMFTKILHLFEGRTVEFPNSKKISEYILLAVCYYYYRIEGKSWDDIKNMFPAHDLDCLSLSLKIHHLDVHLRQRITEIIEREEEELRNVKQ